MAISAPSEVRVLSLFSGIGGLDLGVQRALGAVEQVGYVEREAYAVAVLGARIADGSLAPGPVFLGDIRAFPAADFRGRVDLVLAGFPCPPVSTAGKRLGTADERWLWPEVARVLRETGAGWVMVENVSGLLSAQAGRAFGGILADLDALGFDAEWASVRASDVGAPHRRERVFVLGRRRDRGREGDGVVPHPGEPGAGATLPPGRGLHERGLAGPAHAEDDAGAHVPPARQGRPAGADARGPGGAVVHAPGGRAGAAQLERLDRSAEPSGEAVDDADRPGLEGRAGGGEGAHEFPIGQDGPPLWPPGPGERDEWRRILALWPGLAPAVESDLRRVADGAPRRVDRLRALGNAVVPAQSALALRILVDYYARTA